jgi:uncharacterized lipoprotein YddW (UPF0748 family)
MRRGLAIAAILCGLALLPARAADEVRALWVVRTSLTSPMAVTTMVDAARSSHFNTLLVQIRGRADAYYAEGLEPRASLIGAEPGFDPLAATLARAHDAGLQVHAWINVNLVSSANELPVAREHVIYRHPEWLMVPRALAADLASLDPHGPEYLGRLSRYVRAQPGEVEGLYVSPIPEAAAEYTVRVVQDIVTRYGIDGVHFDFVRYPNDEFDYSREALAEFRRYVSADLQPAETRRYDARLAGEPLIYTQAFPDRWRAFRRARMSALMRRLHDAVRAIRPSATISAAVIPDAADAAARRLQDWRTWVEAGFIDVICPMAYTTDGRLFATQIAAAREIVGGRPVWAGIGAYRLSSSQIVENVQVARRLGAGIVLFSYDSLTDPPHGTEYLAEVARAAFTSQ